MTVFLMPRRNGSPYRALVLGATGGGKTSLGVSLPTTVARHYPHIQVVKTNREFNDQSRTTSRQHKPPQPTLRGKPETMTMLVGDAEIDWEFWPGEDAMFNEAVDVGRLDALLEGRQADILVLALNPFQHDLELAAYSFLELTWSVQSRTGFPLGKSAGIAAGLLWGHGDEADLAKLNADFDELTEPQLRDGRVVRRQAAKFGLPLDQCFRVEGCDGGAEVMDVFVRTARTTGAHALEVLNLRALAARRPDSTVVVGTKDDLRFDLPGVGEAEFLKACRGIFPDPTAIRLGQVVPQASIDFTLRKNKAAPVWVEGPSDRSRPLLESVFGMLRRRPGPSGQVGRHEPDRRGWAAAAAAAVAVGAIPVALMVSGWALLPLLFILAWAVVFCFAESWKWPWPKRATRPRAQPEPPAPADPPAATENRIAEHLHRPNGKKK